MRNPYEQSSDYDPWALLGQAGFRRRSSMLPPTGVPATSRASRAASSRKGMVSHGDDTTSDANTARAGLSGRTPDGPAEQRAAADEILRAQNPTPDGDSRPGTHDSDQAKGNPVAAGLREERKRWEELNGDYRAAKALEERALKQLEEVEKRPLLFARWGVPQTKQANAQLLMAHARERRAAAEQDWRLVAASLIPETRKTVEHWGTGSDPEREWLFAQEEDPYGRRGEVRPVGNWNKLQMEKEGAPPDVNLGGIAESSTFEQLSRRKRVTPDQTASLGVMYDTGGGATTGILNKETGKVEMVPIPAPGPGQRYVPPGASPQAIAAASGPEAKRDARELKQQQEKELERQIVEYTEKEAAAEAKAKGVYAGPRKALLAEAKKYGDLKKEAQAKLDQLRGTAKGAAQ